MITALVTKLFGGSMLKAGAVIVPVLAVGVYVGVLKIEIWGLERTINNQRVEISELKVSLAHEKGEVRACKARIEETNKRIDDLREDRKSRERMFDMLNQNIDLIRESTSRDIRDLEAVPTPQSCEDAMNLLREGLR